MSIDEKLLNELSDRPTMDSVERLIGKELLGNLSDELGGRHLYVSTKPTPNSPLATVIGMEASLLMAQVWGGMEFVVPVSIGRRNKILMMLQREIPIVRISAHLKISSRTVRRVANERKEDNQLSLL